VERRDDIQGLRAVAVLLVALGHAGVPFLRGGFVGTITAIDRGHASRAYVLELLQPFRAAFRRELFH